MLYYDIYKVIPTRMRICVSLKNQSVFVCFRGGGGALLLLGDWLFLGLTLEDFADRKDWTLEWILSIRPLKEWAYEGISC